MIKVVLDTAVLAESFWNGPSKRVIDLWKAGDVTLCVSSPILREYTEVIARLGVKAKDREEFVSLFSENPSVSMVDSARRVNLAQKEPVSNMFLDCAVAGGADFIITTEPYLLELESYRGITLALPEDFVKAHSVSYRQ
jgi:hypothetical protein